MSPSQLLGGYIYQAHVAILRLIDVLDPLSPATQVVLEKRRTIEGKDYFDDLEVTNENGLLHRYQVKWGSKQSAETPSQRIKLADLVNASSELSVASLFRTWSEVGKNNLHIFCHIFTSKSIDPDLGQLTMACPVDFQRNSAALRLSDAIYDKLSKENQHQYPVGEFRTFLDHLVLEFDQPALHFDDEAHGQMIDTIVQRIESLGLPRAVFIENRRLNAIDLYHKLYAIATDAAIGGKPLSRAHILRGLGVDESRGRLSQPSLIDEQKFVLQDQVESQLESTISSIPGGAILLMGRPAAGKSWFLERWQKKREKEGLKTPIFFCFRGLDDANKDRRPLETQVIGNLLADFDRLWPEIAVQAHYENSLDGLSRRLHALIHSLPLGEKQVLIIDGLDHAIATEETAALHERTAIDLVSSIIIPDGIVLVVGTQPGVHLQGLSSVRAKIDMTGFNEHQTKEYLHKVTRTSLSDELCGKLHHITDGLPLLLSIIAGQIDSRDVAIAVDKFVADLPQTAGVVQTYYEYLWQRLPGQIRHSLETSATRILKLLSFKKPAFRMSRESLMELLTEMAIPTNEVEAALESVECLLDQSLLATASYDLCHASLHVFIRTKCHNEAATYLRLFHNWCRVHQDLSQGNRFILQYAFDLELFGQIVGAVDLGAIDTAIMNLFPREDTLRNIKLAIEAAQRKHDLQAILRLGLLHSATLARFENIDRIQVLKALAASGDADKILDQLSYDGHLSVPPKEALDLLLNCIRSGINDLPYYNLYTDLSRHIAELDSEARKELSLDDFIRLAVASGHAADYFNGAIKRAITHASPETSMYYLSSFVDALGEFGTKSEIESYATLPEFAKLQRRLNLARLYSLTNTDELVTAKSQWVVCLSETTDADVLSLLRLGCKLGCANSALAARINYKDVIPNPPTGYHVDDEFIRLVKKLLDASFVLAYLKKDKDIKQLSVSVSAWPRSLLREIVEVGVLVYAGSGSKLRDTSLEVDFGVLLRPFTYEEQPGEQPRVVDVSTSPGLSELLCEIIEEASLAVAPSQHSQLGAILAEIVKLRHSYRIGGYSYTFPNTSQLLNSMRKSVGNNPHGDLCTPLHQPIEQIYQDILASEGYAGQRTSALLEISALWSLVGDRQKARDVRSKALLDSHTYGNHKDITLPLFVRSLHETNAIDHIGTLERCKSALDLSRFLGWLTDWKEVRHVVPDICDELSQRDMQAGIKLLELFASMQSRVYYDACLRSVIRYASGNHRLRMALANTIAETSDSYGSLSRLLRLQLCIVSQAWEAGDNNLASELLELVRTTIFQNVSASVRPKIARIFNELAVKLGASLLGYDPEDASDAQTGLSREFSIDGHTYSKEQFATLAESLRVTDVLRLLESPDVTKASWASDMLCNRLMHLVGDLDDLSELDTLTKNIEGLPSRRDIGLLYWAIALRYREFGKSAEFLLLGQRACELSLDWGGVFSNDNADRLAFLAKNDQEFVADFLLKYAYEAALDGRSTAWAYSVVQHVFSSFGNKKIVMSTWSDFSEFVSSLFRHAPAERSAYDRILVKSDEDVSVLLEKTLVERLNDDELEVRHRAGRELARLTANNERLQKQLLEKAQTTSDETHRQLCLIVLQYALSISPQIPQIYDFVRSFLNQSDNLYTQSILREILIENGESPRKQVFSRAQPLLLTEPTKDFCDKVLYNCRKNTRSVVLEAAETAGLTLETVLLWIEQDLIARGISYESVFSNLKEQLNYFRTPNLGTIPFDPAPDSVVRNSLYRVLATQATQLDNKTVSDLESVIRCHDSKFWTVPLGLKPKHIPELPLGKHEVDTWLESGENKIVRQRLSDSEDESVVVAESRSFDNEQIGLQTYSGLIFLHTGTVVEKLDLSLGAPFLKPPDHIRTLSDFKFKYTSNQLLVSQSPVISYLPNWWFHQGECAYLRFHPRICTVLKLDWSEAALNMIHKGVEAVRFEQWRDGFTDNDHARDIEHSGCYLTCSKRLLRDISTHFGVDVCVLKWERRTRKAEKWANGRLSEDRDSKSAVLYKSS